MILALNLLHILLCSVKKKKKRRKRFIYLPFTIAHSQACHRRHTRMEVSQHHRILALASPAPGDAWRVIAGLQQALLAALPCSPHRPCQGEPSRWPPAQYPSPSALNHEQKGDLQHHHLQQVLHVARSETALVAELSAKPNPRRIRPQCGYPLGPRPTKHDWPQNKRNKRTVLSTFATVTSSAHPVIFWYHSSHRHEITPFPSTVTHK